MYFQKQPNFEQNVFLSIPNFSDNLIIQKIYQLVAHLMQFTILILLAQLIHSNAHLICIILHMLKENM